MIRILTSHYKLVTLLFLKCVWSKKEPVPIIDQMGNIEADFIRIFSDIKNIRSIIPTPLFQNITFEPDIGRFLLEEPSQFKRASIINAPDGLTGKKKGIATVSVSLEKDLPMAFLTRKEDPLHKIHGVGEGLALLPVFNALRLHGNNGDNVSNRSTKFGEKNLTIRQEIIDTISNSSNNSLQNEINGMIRQIGHHFKDERNKQLDSKKLVNQSLIRDSTFNKLVGLDNVSNSTLYNFVLANDLSKKHKIQNRNMIFETKIRGFLAKLDSYRFSDIGSRKKDVALTFQKNNHNKLCISRKKIIESKKQNASMTIIYNEKKVPIHDNALHKKEKISMAEKKDTIDAIFEPECSAKKKCPSNKYCRHFQCFECHHKHHECISHEQCCDGMPCIYGRCDTKIITAPGSICKNDGDCGSGCCVLEPTINLESGICKIKLAEFHQCSPVLYRKVWIGDKRPTCGPCEDHLECVNKGVIATHLVCMKIIG